MNKKFRKILALALLSMCGVSKISQNSYAATEIENTCAIKLADDADNNLLKKINWKKVGIGSGIALAGILALFGTHKVVSYLTSSPRLDDLPKKEVPEIVDLQKNYESKRNLSAKDVEYKTWLENLPNNIVKKISGNMLDCWKYLLNNFENEIDLNIYVGFHDNAENWDLGHKGIKTAFYFGINDNSGSRRGILEHAMKLKNGLPFEKSDAMGFFAKEEIVWALDNTISCLNCRKNKIKDMIIFCRGENTAKVKALEIYQNMFKLRLMSTKKN